MAKKTASKAVRKLQKKIGTVGMVLTILALVIGIAIGVVLAISKTGKDDFYLTGDKDIIIVAGETKSWSSLRGDFYAVHLGKNVKMKVMVNPSFEVGEDGNVTLEEGTYYISYTMPALFGTQEVVLYRTITVIPELTGGDSNG